MPAPLSRRAVLAAGVLALAVAAGSGVAAAHHRADVPTRGGAGRPDPSTSAAPTAPSVAHEVHLHDGEQAATPPQTRPIGWDWPRGVIDDPEAPASGSRFLGRNRWVGLVGGRVVAVYAGAAGVDDAGVASKDGRVLVQWADGATSASPPDLVGSGPLRVISEGGGRLVLHDAGGARHVLDLTRWVWSQ